MSDDRNLTKKQELRQKLTPEQYVCTQENGTEAPFRNAYWNNHEAGIYVDVVSGEPLFGSGDKFDSGTGWPSFTRPLEGKNLVTREDRKLFMSRTEVRSKQGDSHLGHVFDDGPAPTGMRYCINSASLRFIPVAKLEAEGYGAYLPLFGAGSSPGKSGAESAADSSPGPSDDADQAVLKKKSGGNEIALLAGGCFWGVQELIRALPGVVETSVGYTGGHVDSPRYEEVKTGRTGHAEAIRIVFDPARISFEDLLAFFFRLHDPTTLNQQGNDRGTQYRSAIFYQSEEQRQTAERVKSAVERSGKWKRPVVTVITPAKEFYPAEDDHQDYLKKNPGGYTCHFLRD